VVLLECTSAKRASATALTCPDAMTVHDEYLEQLSHILSIIGVPVLQPAEPPAAVDGGVAAASTPPVEAASGADPAGSRVYSRPPTATRVLNIAGAAVAAAMTEHGFEVTTVEAQNALCSGDPERLPFESATFSAVVMGSAFQRERACGCGLAVWLQWGPGGCHPSPVLLHGSTFLHAHLTLYAAPCWPPFALWPLSPQTPNHSIHPT